MLSAPPSKTADITGENDEEHVCMEGEALAKDCKLFKLACQDSYDMNFEIIEKKPFDEKKFAEDIFMKDTELWKIKVLLKVRRENGKI